MKRAGFLLGIISMSISVWAQTSVDAYLKDNNSELRAELQSGKLTEEDFKESQYILLGEVHGFADVQDVDIALLKLLNSKYQLKYYIAEVDDAKAWLLNQYLATGDESLLHRVFKSWERDTAQWANLPYFNKYQKLYEYQKQLAPNRRITVLGIDQPQDYSIVKQYLAFLTQAVKGHAFQPEINQLNKAINEEEESAIAQAALKCLAKINKEKSTTAGLGSSYHSLLLLLNNLASINKTRDGVMFDNLQRYINTYQLQHTKMYGFLGFFHCLQASYNQSSPFAYLLKKTMKAKVTSIVSYYKDGMIMMPYNAQMKQMIPAPVATEFRSQHPGFSNSEKYIPLPYSNDQSNPMMEKMDQMESLVRLSQPSSVSLFKLNRDNSPFRTQKTFAEVKGLMGLQLSDAASNTTDAFQYILLFRNPQAASPK